MFGNGNRGQLRPVHAREGDEIAAGIDHGHVEQPAVLVGFRDSGDDRVLRLLQRDLRAIGNIEGHFSPERRRADFARAPPVAGLLLH